MKPQTELWVGKVRAEKEKKRKKEKKEKSITKVE